MMGMDVMLMWAAFAAGAFLLGLIGVGVFLPKRLRVERAVIVDAPASEIFPVINDVKSWADRIVFPDTKGTELKLHYPQGVVGEGASVEWDGGRRRKRGYQHIVDSVPDKYIKARVAIGNFRGRVSFRLLEQEEDRTLVIWQAESRSLPLWITRYANPVKARIFARKYEIALERLRGFFGMKAT